MPLPRRPPEAPASPGQPAALTGMPGGRDTAVLFILRELMHYLGFDAISLIEGATS